MPERADSEHDRGSDQYRSSGHLFDDNTRFEISAEGSSGAMNLARTSHPRIGVPIPAGLERHVEFNIVCP